MHATQAKYELISKIFAERIERDGLLMKDHLAREDHFDERWCAATPLACVGSVGCGCAGCCCLLSSLGRGCAFWSVLICWPSVGGCGWG